MSYQEIINKIKPELEKTIKFLEGELAKIRTSHLSPSLVENLKVSCFGEEFLLKQLAAISSPQANQILIQPWDKSYLEPILSAISRQNLNFTPVVDKEVIRLSLPPLSTEHRDNLLKIVSEKSEQTRKTVRHWRQVAWDEIQDGFKEGRIREDDKFRGKDELQKLIDEYNEKIKELVERKKKEIKE